MPLRDPCRCGRRLTGLPLRPHRIDSIVQRPRTPPFHGGNTGSNPVGVTISFFSVSYTCEFKRVCADQTVGYCYFFPMTF